jgi:hypothetical protein
VHTVAQYLPPLRPALPPALIGAAGWAAILAVAAWLPGPLAHSVFMFECRLGDPHPAADFLVCASARHGGRLPLTHLDAPGSPAAALLTHPIWQRVAALARHWADPTTPLHDALTDVWFEFDLPGAAPAIPLPSVFFGRPLSSPAGASADQPAQPRDLMPQAIRLLTGRDLPAPIAGQLAACLAALPPGALAPVAAVMLARDTAAIRLVLDGVACAEVLPYLARIGWPGPRDPVAQVLPRVAALCDYVWLDLDVEATLAPKLGLECVFHPGPAQAGWPAVFAYLAERGLCQADKSAAVLAYPGTLAADAAGAAWPAPLREAAAVLGPLSYRRLVREISHVKLVFETGEPLEAKVYLTAYYQ